MRRRLIATLAAVTAALLSGSGLATAGGWAMTSIDSAPDDIVAGQTYQVDYTVRQHGDKPVAVDDTFIQITSEATGETLQFPGQATDTTGHYTAAVTIPAEGHWNWQVSQGWFGMQELGTLQAQAPASGSVWTSATTRTILPLAALLALVLLVIQSGWFARERQVEGHAVEPLPGSVSGD